MAFMCFADKKSAGSSRCVARTLTFVLHLPCFDSKTGLDRGVTPSMDGQGAWRDNVFLERLWPPSSVPPR